ncbi:MAG: DUF3240 family protein, partial [Rubrivivax sp.]
MSDPGPDVCLTLICPPTVEEKLLDVLLANAGSEVFTSTPTSSHGTAQGRLTATEQVMGRSHAVQVNVLLTNEELNRLRALLQREFAGTGVRYWA